MALTRQQERRRMLLRKLVIDSFTTYADAAVVVGYSESWLKSRLAPGAEHAINDRAIDVIKARLASAGIAGGDLLR